MDIQAAQYIVCPAMKLVAHYVVEKWQETQTVMIETHILMDNVITATLSAVVGVFENPLIKFPL